MAKPILKPRFKSPQAVFPVPPFITQAEIMNVLRLRSQLNAIQMELEDAQTDILGKHDGEAGVEQGPYHCAAINAALVVWENEDFSGQGCWRRKRDQAVMG